MLHKARTPAIRRSLDVDHSLRLAFVHTYQVSEPTVAHDQALLSRDIAAMGWLTSQHSIACHGFGLLGPSTKPTELAHSIPWYYAPANDVSNVDQASHRQLRDLSNHIGEWSPDVLLVKGVGNDTSRYLSKHHNVPTVIVIGGRYRARECYSASLVLVEGPEQRNFFEAFLPKERVIDWPKLVDKQFFEPPESCSLYDVAVVSDFLPWKNHRATLPLLRAGLRVVYVGDGPGLAPFKASVKEADCTATFTGRVTSTEVAQLLGRSRVLVHPSTSEGFPRAVAEAMVKGLPVVALAGVVGRPVVDQHNGLLVDEHQLLGATLSLLSDQALYRRLAHNACATGRLSFSTDALQRSTSTLGSRITDILLDPRRRRTAAQSATVVTRVTLDELKRHYGRARAIAQRPRH